MGKLTKTPIHERTEQYWNRFRDDFDCYVEELLGLELDHAHKHPLEDGTPRLNKLPRPLYTLALTVGESFEPLLQVVCVLKPKKLVLILNRKYGTKRGIDQGNHLRRLVGKLATVPGFPDEYRPGLTERDCKPVEVEADTPTEVFRSLRNELQGPEAQPPDGFVNALDITGAKKSMVVGAFLYAAHSELPITYVDFDEYNPDFGRPYGYTCKIGQIPNPYEAFQLRDWEQVRQLYEYYNFRGALELLGTAATGSTPGKGILGVMSSHLEEGKGSHKLYDAEEVAKVERLIQILEMYEVWDNGDFRRAKSLVDAFEPSLSPDLVPWTITELGDIWPGTDGIDDPGSAASHLHDAHLELKHGRDGPEDSFFGRPAQLLAYVRDELAKVERLIVYNEDYRSAYLRAAGLHELLLKARLCICFLNEEVKLTVDGDPPAEPADRHEWFKAIAGLSGPDVMRDALKHRKKLPFRHGRKLELTSSAPVLESYWERKALDLDRVRTTRGQPVFTVLRNESIHTHLYIPDHVAKAALELVKAAVEEFEANWLKHFYPEALSSADPRPVEYPKWPRLCGDDACQLDFLPPKLRN